MRYPPIHLVTGALADHGPIYGTGRHAHLTCSQSCNGARVQAEVRPWALIEGGVSPRLARAESNRHAARGRSLGQLRGLIVMVRNISAQAWEPRCCAVAVAVACLINTWLGGDTGRDAVHWLVAPKAGTCVCAVVWIQMFLFLFLVPVHGTLHGTRYT
jgi:hypothetical protein